MSEKWYKDGLRFTCTQCGNCCTGPPGYVWVTREEIRRIAKFLGRTDEWLPDDVLRRVGFKYSLTERSNGDCVYLVSKNGKRMCSIYPVRPLQCRTWPFWDVNLKSPRAWADAADNVCPGMNNGKLHSFEHIEKTRLRKSWDEGQVDLGRVPRVG